MANSDDPSSRFIEDIGVPGTPAFIKLWNNVAFDVMVQEELSLLIIHEQIKNDLEEIKELDRKEEKISAKQEEKERYEAAKAHAESEPPATSRTVEELHQAIIDRVGKVNELMDQCHKYEVEKDEVDEKIKAISGDIKKLENDWKESWDDAADKFISNNIAANSVRDGKLIYTSVKDPKIELLPAAIEVIKQVIKNVVSPTAMQKIKPDLIDNVERMMALGDVRIELKMAKKVDKILDPENKKKANLDRKILVKRPVRDTNDELVYEMDDKGKKRVKTELVELDPKKDFGTLTVGTSESTNKDKSYRVLGDDVCGMKACMNQPRHTKSQTAIATDVMAKNVEKCQCEARSKELAVNIVEVKKEIKNEMATVDRDIKQIPEAPQEKIMKEVASAKTDPSAEQLYFSADKKIEEKVAFEIPEPPPPPPPPPRMK